MKRFLAWLSAFLESFFVSAGAGMSTEEYERGLEKLDKYLKERGKY